MEIYPILGKTAVMKLPARRSGSKKDSPVFGFAGCVLIQAVSGGISGGKSRKGKTVGIPKKEGPPTPSVGGLKIGSESLEKGKPLGPKK